MLFIDPLEKIDQCVKENRHDAEDHNGHDHGGKLASSYMELEAGALGLGVLYSGFFVMAVRRSERLRSLLSLPAGIEPVTALCIGHSDVKYYRRAPRNEAVVNYV